jgi:hypothetical protein
VKTYRAGQPPQDPAQVPGFSAYTAPKTHWLDRGDVIEAVDEYTMERRGQPFKKGMTTASDRIAAGRRLALDETSPQYMQTDGGLIALPRRPGAGQIAARPVTGEDGQSFSQQV